MAPLARLLVPVLTAVLCGGMPLAAAAAAPAAPVSAATATTATTATTTTAAAAVPRIRHQEAWSEVDVVARPSASAQNAVEGHIQSHSDLTPTGRFVRAGEVLTFDVDPGSAQIGYSVSVGGAHAGVKGSSSAGFRPTSTPLRAGTSRVTAATDGLVHLTGTGSGSTRVRVTGGAPQPVFELNRTTRADLDAQLARWSGSRFVLFLSDRLDAEMQRAQVDTARKSASWDPQATVGYWDRSVELAAEAHGLDPAAAGVARPAGHRIRITNPDSGSGWASATHGAITFPNSTGAGQHLLTARPGTTQWGLWHELGHLYQNSAYRWGGMTEVQVNLYPAHIQRRLGLGTRYTASLDAAKQARALLAKPIGQRASSGPAHEVMFEQLARAFGDAFYPRVNQEYRVLAATGSTPSTDPARIQRFIRTASEVSGYDLSEFFRQWGMPADPATLAQVDPLADLPRPIWTAFDAASMTVVSSLPAYVLPTGTLDTTALPVATLGQTAPPAGWRDRVRDVSSTDGTTGAQVQDAGVIVTRGKAGLWVRLVSATGVRDVLAARLTYDRGNGLDFRGSSDSMPLSVSLAPSSSRWTAISSGKPAHAGVGGRRYLGVEVRSADGQTLVSGSVNGNQNATALVDALHGTPLADGQFLVVFHEEAAKLDAYVNGVAQPRSTARDRAFRVVSGTLQPVDLAAVASPPVLEVLPGIGSTVARVTMSAGVFDHASRYVVRQGGTYAFEIYRGTAPYGWVSRDAANGTVTVTRVLPADRGDVSMHLTPGAPGESTAGSTLVSTFPAVAGEATAEQLQGVYGFPNSPSTVLLYLSDTSFRSATRHVVTVNGTSVFETAAGRAHHARLLATGGGTTLAEGSVPDLKAGDVVEVRLVSGVAGAPVVGGAVAFTYTVTAEDVAPH